MPDSHLPSRSQVAALILSVATGSASLAATSRVYSSFPLDLDIETLPRRQLPFVSTFPSGPLSCHASWLPRAGWQAWFPPLLVYGDIQAGYGTPFYLVDGASNDDNGRTLRAGSLYYPFVLPGRGNDGNGNGECAYGAGQILLFLPGVMSAD